MDIDTVLRQMTDVLAQQGGQIEQLQTRLVQVEADLEKVDEVLAQMLKATEQHGKILRAIVQPQPAPAVKKLLN